MNKLVSLAFTAIILVASGDLARAATTVPNEIQQPGTQPSQVGNLESPDKCDNCHGGYNQAVEPAFNWRGSMMANAGRDPIFWATMAVAEQDFDGAGDLCIRCHSTGGWYGGRSTPTDGSGAHRHGCRWRGLRFMPQDDQPQPERTPRGDAPAVPRQQRA